MEQYGITQPSSPGIDVAKYQPQTKGIEKLEQVLMEQTKGQGGQEYRNFLTILSGAVDDLLSANIFLQQRCQNDHHEDLQRIGVHGVFRNGILGSATGQEHG